MSASFNDALSVGCSKCKEQGICPKHFAEQNIFSEEEEEGGYAPLDPGETFAAGASAIDMKNQRRIALALENMNFLLSRLSETLGAINENLKHQRK